MASPSARRNNRSAYSSGFGRSPIDAAFHGDADRPVVPTVAEGTAIRNPLRAATWCFDNGVALSDGAAWLDKSIAAQANHANLSLKARWLAKDGKKTEAIAAAERAIAAGKAAKPPVDTAATEKLLTEWTATAKK